MTDHAERASDLSWQQWLLAEERSHARILLAILLPIALLFATLDLRFEGSQMALNLGLRLLVISLMAAGLWALVTEWDPIRTRRLLSAMLLAHALFITVRYGQGLGLGGVPGHLPSDLLLILVIFMIPSSIMIRAIVAAVLVGASAVDYIVYKEVQGSDAALLAITLLLAWGLGLALSLRRRRGLRKRYEALQEIHLLRSSIPICAWCKAIRNDDGIWQRLESYLTSHADMMLTHGVCPQCMAQVEAGDDHSGNAR